MLPFVEYINFFSSKHLLDFQSILPWPPEISRSVLLFFNNPRENLRLFSRSFHRDLPGISMDHLLYTLECPVIFSTGFFLENKPPFYLHYCESWIKSLVLYFYESSKEIPNSTIYIWIFNIFKKIHKNTNIFIFIVSIYISFNLCINLYRKYLNLELNKFIFTFLFFTNTYA